MTKDNGIRVLPFAAITALLLCVGAMHPPAAHAAQTVAVSMVNAEGKPLPTINVVLLNDDGLVATNGKTDDKGRYCVPLDGLTVGKEYKVCALQADNTTGPCVSAPASEAECADALAALGAGKATPRAAADGHPEGLGAGVGAGTVGAANPAAPSGTAASGPTEAPQKAMVTPTVGKNH